MSEQIPALQHIAASEGRDAILRAVREDGAVITMKLRDPVLLVIGTSANSVH